MARLFAISVLLSALAATVIDAGVDGGETLRRQKREWIIPPKKLLENVDYTSEESIAKIRSDEETTNTILYSLEGPGADQDPVGLFTVDEKSGLVKIHGILDREKTPSFLIKGIAKLPHGQKVEKDIVLRITVLDQNDCTPVFSTHPVDAIPELSPTGTYVINITATDDDEPKSPNSTVTYSIAQQIPTGSQMFQIDPNSGRISVKLDTLDRELQDNYTLIIHGTDNGPALRNTGTGTVSINVLDINDNFPFLEKNLFEGSVEENTVSVEVVRLQTIDKDQVNTDNWRAVYSIISGNEAGYFKITTDSITNEGILTVIKGIDYEEVKEVYLKIVVSNKAKYHTSVKQEPTIYPIKIRVVNVPEVPRFRPAIKVISISEDHKTIDLKRVIATYPAIDSDTLLSATNVRYYKGQDVDNWLNIDETNAEIRLNKLPDRESKYLVNGTYFAQIICITSDHPAKTATGTVAIQVEDFNDHCPVLTSMAQTVCSEESVVYVTAVDKDAFPNAEPFSFKLVTTDTEKIWNIEHLNATTAIVRAQRNVWPGYYTVGLEVRDQQGKFCDVQQLHVTVCTCDKTKVCKSERHSDSGIRLGAGGVFAMLMGLLLLLLVPLLLLIIVCGGAATAAGFRTFPADQAQSLITYHTEGVGEDKEVSLLQFPLGNRTKAHRDSVGGKGWGWGWGGGVQEDLLSTRDQWHAGQHVTDYSDQKGSVATMKGMVAMTGIALPDRFLGSYYSTKARRQPEQHSENEYLRVYEYEDQDSSMGSLENICEHLHGEDNLAFLDDLGPRFKTLAELCCGPAIETQISSAVQPLAPPPNASPVPSGAHTDIRVKGTMGRVHTEAGSSTSVSASTSTSHVAATGHQESSIASSTALITQSAQVPSHTLVLQQPPMYYTSTPVYVVEQQGNPTLLMAARPGLVPQENIMLIDQRGAGVALPASHSASRELKHMETKVAEGWPAVETTASLGLHSLGSASGSGSFRLVESEQVQTVEPLQVWQSSSHSSVSVGESVHAGVPSGLMRGYGTSPTALVVSQQDAGLLTVPQGGAHQQVQEERASVVQKSFQTISTS